MIILIAILCSAYFPGVTDFAPLEKIKVLIQFCKVRNKHLIVGCDANANQMIVSG